MQPSFGTALCWSLVLKNWLLIFFVSLKYEWKNRHARTCRFFHSYLKETKKTSTVNSYNLISYHFHTKSKGKEPQTKTKFKLNRKHKNKLTNGHGGVIIQLRAAIFERIWNAQIKAVETVPFLFCQWRFHALLVFDSSVAVVTLFTMT